MKKITKVDSEYLLDAIDAAIYQVDDVSESVSKRDAESDELIEFFSSLNDDLIMLRNKVVEMTE